MLADRGISLPCGKWFREFYSTYHDIAHETLATRECRDRAAKQNEEVVQNHFYGHAGLQEELMDAGIMDAEGRIDPWRMWWLDECPNMIDYNSEKGGGRKKRGAGTGKKAVINSPENRECPTVSAVQALSGFMGGLQMIIPRKYAHGDMAPVSDCWRLDARVFDDTIDLASLNSRHCTISHTENGMQTAASMRQWLQTIDAELTQLEEKLDRTLRPIVMGMDQASAHCDERFMEDALEKGIRVWYEESKTSHFLQCLDQYFRKWHLSYRKNVKLERLIRKKPSLKIDWEIFTMILCRSWFTWSEPIDRINSFRKVGITSLELRPDLINRATFYVQKDIDEDEAKEPVLNTTVEEPEGVEVDSKEYWKAKFERSQGIVEKLVNVPCTPKEAGVLQLSPTTCQEWDSKRDRLNDEAFGSCKLKDMIETKKRKRLAAEEDRERIESNKIARIEKKSAAQAAKEVAMKAWAACALGCACGVSPCPWAKKVYCLQCRELKTGQCRKIACKKAAQAALEAPQSPQTLAIGQ